MCGRTSLYRPRSRIEDRFGARFIQEWVPRYNISPSQDLAVIQNEAPEEIDQLEWGLLPHWVDDPEDWPKPINARAESLTERASFREAFEKRRCLVLADGFYEWQGQRGSKRPYRIERVDDDPFAFAGLWERWSENGGTRETVTIITTDSNEVVEPIHDRMPVILEPGEEREWLAETDPAELQSLLGPFPNELTDAYEVSTAVNDPANDTPAVVEPIAGEQSGLDDFG